MLIDKLMNDSGPGIYYDDGFRNVLEDHMTYLRAHPKTTQLSVDPAKLYQFEFDLFGLLQMYNIPAELHWLTMRMNEMHAPTDVRDDITYLLVPDLTTVNRIRQSHMTNTRVI